MKARHIVKAALQDRQYLSPISRTSSLSSIGSSSRRPSSPSSSSSSGHSTPASPPTLSDNLQLPSHSGTSSAKVACLVMSRNQFYRSSDIMLIPIRHSNTHWTAILLWRSNLEHTNTRPYPIICVLPLSYYSSCTRGTDMVHIQLTLCLV